MRNMPVKVCRIVGKYSPSISPRQVIADLIETVDSLRVVTSIREQIGKFRKIGVRILRQRGTFRRNFLRRRRVAVAFRHLFGCRYVKKVVHVL